MAQVSGVYRVIIIPLNNNQGDEANILTNSLLASLMNTPTDLLVAAMELSYLNYHTWNGSSFDFHSGTRIALLLTLAGDAAVVANLTAFQTSLGQGTIASWSYPITYGV